MVTYPIFVWSHTPHSYGHIPHILVVTYPIFPFKCFYFLFQIPLLILYFYFRSLRPFLMSRGNHQFLRVLFYVCINMTFLKVSVLCSDDSEIIFNFLLTTLTLMFLSTSFTNWHLEAKRICHSEQNTLAQFRFMSFTNNPVTCVRYETQPVRQVLFLTQNGVFICSFKLHVSFSSPSLVSAEDKQTLCTPLKDSFTCLCGLFKNAQQNWRLVKRGMII